MTNPLLIQSSCTLRPNSLAVARQSLRPGMCPIADHAARYVLLATKSRKPSAIHRGLGISIAVPAALHRTRLAIATVGPLAKIQAQAGLRFWRIPAVPAMDALRAPGREYPVRLAK